MSGDAILKGMNLLIILCAKYLVFFVGLIALVYWLTLPKLQKIRIAVVGAVTAIVAFALTKIGGALFYDPRPFVTHHLTPLLPHAADNGFPSDHTVFAATIAVTIFFASKRLGMGLFALAAVVGVARILAHVHSPIDVLGSLVFAVAGGAAAYYLAPIVMDRVSPAEKKDPN